MLPRKGGERARLQKVLTNIIADPKTKTDERIEIMKLKEKCEMLERKEELGKKKISELEEEITALRQLLDCAAANIALLVTEQGGVRRISAEDVRRALGKYELAARRDGSDYLMEVSERADA